jgi:hypothetical protein
MVTFQDNFQMIASGPSTIFFVLRFCSGGGIPFPMRFEASIASVTENDREPSSAVCLLSGVQENWRNPVFKSLMCESSVGMFIVEILRRSLL